MSDEITLKPDNGVTDPRQLEAINAIALSEIPTSALKERPGASGKTFTYVEHTWVTETLQKGLPNQWDFKVLDWEVFTDTLKIKKKDTYIDRVVRSVAARCQFTLKILVNPELRKFEGDPLYMERTVTEVGVFEINPAMSTAFGVAAAVSRGLCRCVMRSIGLGLELYTGGDDIDPNKAWTSLKVFAVNQGWDWDNNRQDYIDALQEVGITRENIVDKYSTAYEILATMVGKVTELEEMPT
jgi:hypothetical protein